MIIIIKDCDTLYYWTKWKFFNRFQIQKKYHFILGISTLWRINDINKFKVTVKPKIRFQFQTLFIFYHLIKLQSVTHTHSRRGALEHYSEPIFFNFQIWHASLRLRQRTVTKCVKTCAIGDAVREKVIPSRAGSQMSDMVTMSVAQYNLG